jgi:hypothetical protein
MSYKSLAQEPDRADEVHTIEDAMVGAVAFVAWGYAVVAFTYLDGRYAGPALILASLSAYFALRTLVPPLKRPDRIARQS